MCICRNHYFVGENSVSEFVNWALFTKENAKSYIFSHFGGGYVMKGGTNSGFLSGRRKRGAEAKKPVFCVTFPFGAKTLLSIDFKVVSNGK